MSAPASAEKKLPSVRPFYASTKFLIGFIIAAVVYSVGWRVTEMNPSALLKDAHLVRPLITALLQPEVAVRETESKTLETPFTLESDTGFGFGAPPVKGGGSSGPLTVAPVSGHVGDRVTVSGQGLTSNTRGRLVWVNSVEQEFPLGEVVTDASGNFAETITVPETARDPEQRVRLELFVARGGWKISGTMKLTLEKIVETVFLGLMATTLAVFFAAPLGFLGARNLMRGRVPRALYYAVRFAFNILRSIEPLIMAILFAVWVGIGPFAGVLALAVHSTAALGKLFSEQIESIDPGPVEAITATGAKPLQIVLYGVLPQVVPQFLALTFYRWDINVRMSTIIGFVGGGGIGFLLQQWINLLQYNKAATALWAIAAVVIALDLISARIREKITTV